MARRFMCETLVCACLGLSMTMLAPAAGAVTDVLETPARATELAPQSLLNDATRAGDRIVAVGERGHVIYSDDQGETWTQAEVPVSVTLNAVDFGTEQHGWAVGHSGAVLHSPDAGASWQLQFDGLDAGELIIDSRKRQIAEMEARIEQAPEEEKGDLEWALDDLLFSLENAQADLDIGPVNPFLDVWFENDSHGFVVGAYGMIFQTRDGGESWQDWAPNLDNPWNLHYNAITRIEGGALVLVGESGQIHVSEDNGETWTRRESPYDGSFFGVTGTDQPGEILAFGLRGTILHSVDLGQSWNRVSGNSNATLNSASQAAEERLVLVGNAGAVLVSDDGGDTFSASFRTDRQGVMAAIPIAGGDLLLVGEGGVKQAGPSGQNTD